MRYFEHVTPDENRPLIKCNIRKYDLRRIFHLPWDAHYDKVQIDIVSGGGEFYAKTIGEAVAHGFVRAKRWNGVVRTRRREAA